MLDFVIQTLIDNRKCLVLFNWFVCVYEAQKGMNTHGEVQNCGELLQRTENLSW